MFRLNEVLKKNNLKPRKYTKRDSVMLVSTDSGRYVVKERTRDNQFIYDYLKSRSFDYMPMVVNCYSDDYEITKYIESFDIPDEQKILDLIDLVALLHNKTTHYREVTEDDYKEIYEDLKNNVEYLYTYYMDLITLIESKVYMSPSEYVLARNISKIFSDLDFLNDEIDKWYDIVKEKKKKRLVVLHNNLELDHFIVNKQNFLTSWDKSKIDIPIFDIYKLYLRHGLDFDFAEIFRRYERNYPLSIDERKLFFILILLPPKVEFNKSEYENTREVGKMIDFIYKTEMFVSPYYSEKGEKDNAYK